MNNPPINILIIDDHPLFSKGLRFLLEHEAGFNVIGLASDGLSGIKMVRQLMPDIVLLDLDMPVMNGIETLEQLLNYQPELPILMLTVSENTRHLRLCINKGARGYVLKNTKIDFLLKAINQALDGNVTISAEMQSKVSSLVNSEESLDTEELTEREDDVLLLIADGISNKLIARALDISENTVKVHIQNIMRKLNLRRRVQIAIWAQEQGLTSHPD